MDSELVLKSTQIFQMALLYTLRQQKIKNLNLLSLQLQTWLLNLFTSWALIKTHMWNQSKSWLRALRFSTIISQQTLLEINKIMSIRYLQISLSLTGPHKCLAIQKTTNDFSWVTVDMTQQAKSLITYLKIFLQMPLRLYSLRMRIGLLKACLENSLNKNFWTTSLFLNTLDLTNGAMFITLIIASLEVAKFTLYSMEHRWAMSSSAMASLKELVGFSTPHLMIWFYWCHKWKSGGLIHSEHGMQMFHIVGSILKTALKMRKIHFCSILTKESSQWLWKLW